MPQGVEQSSYQEGGCHDREGGLLTRENDEHPLQQDDAAEVECDQRGGERTVDEGAVDDHVYVVEAILEDGDVSADWNGQQSEQGNMGEVPVYVP